MPHQMSEWIRDSTTLWIKNGGAGTPTTEDALKEKASDEEIAALRTFYERQIAEMKAAAQAQDAKILKLYNDL